MKINKKMVIRILITLLCIVYSISTVAYAGFVNQFDGPFHPKAEPGAFCQNYFHKSMIFCTTSSIVRSDVSTSTASSALRSGEISLVISL